MRFSHYILSIILIIAFSLRVWGINFGLPHIQHSDEASLIHTALYMAAEKGRPNIYVHGTVYPSMMAVYSGVYYLGGRLSGWFYSSQDFLEAYASDPTMIVLLGRITTVIVGLLTVWLVYLVGKRIYNERIGLIACLFLAVSVLHVKESHYVKPDVLTALVTLLMFYVTYLISGRGLLGYYALAGVIFAFGVGVKASLVFVLPIIIFAHVLWKLKLGRRLEFKTLVDSKLIVFIFSSVIVFFIVSPYVVADPKFFLSEIKRWNETLALSRGYDHSTLWYYVFEYLKEGLGVGVWLMSFMGVGLAFLGFKKKENLLLLAFPILFLASVIIWSKEHNQRYILPIVPHLVLIAAIAVDRIYERLPGRKFFRKVAVVLGVGVIIYQPLVRSIKFDFLINRGNLGKQATEWIEKHIAEETVIAVEGVSRPYYLPAHGPYIYPTRESVQKIIEDVPSGRNNGRVLQAIERSLGGKLGYQILATPNLAFRYDPEFGAWDLAEHGKITNADYYIEKGVEVLVANSWAHGDMYKWTGEFAQSLEERYMLVEEFVPSVEFRFEPYLGRMDYEALDRVNIFDKRSVFGPRISIYKRM